MSRQWATTTDDWIQYRTETWFGKPRLWWLDTGTDRSRFVIRTTQLMMQERSAASCLTNCHHQRIGYTNLLYIKLSTCSTMLPSAVMSDGCAPELVFWIVVFGQETRRSNIEAELLKLGRYLTASCVDGTKKELNCLAPTSMPGFYDICSSIQLIAMEKRADARIQPCLTPESWCGLKLTGQILTTANLCTCVFMQCLGKFQKYVPFPN